MEWSRSGSLYDARHKLDVIMTLEGLREVLGNRGEVCWILEAFAIAFCDFSVADSVETHLVKASVTGRSAGGFYLEVSRYEQSLTC